MYYEMASFLCSLLYIYQYNKLLTSRNAILLHYSLQIDG
jgi:hypothetical protein